MRVPRSGRDGLLIVNSETSPGVFDEFPILSWNLSNTIVDNSLWLSYESFSPVSSSENFVDEYLTISGVNNTFLDYYLNNYKDVGGGRSKVFNMYLGMVDHETFIGDFIYFRGIVNKIRNDFIFVPTPGPRTFWTVNFIGLEGSIPIIRVPQTIHGDYTCSYNTCNDNNTIAINDKTLNGGQVPNVSHFTFEIIFDMPIIRMSDTNGYPSLISPRPIFKQVTMRVQSHFDYWLNNIGTKKRVSLFIDTSESISVGSSNLQVTSVSDLLVEPATGKIVEATVTLRDNIRA